MRRGLAINVPCPLCLEMIISWQDGDEETECPWGGPGGNAIAFPCGHSLEEMWQDWKKAQEGRIDIGYLPCRSN